MNNYKIITGLLAVLFGYLLGAAFGAYNAQALTFQHFELQGTSFITAKGTFEYGDDDKFEDFIVLHDADVVALDSYGGNLMAGLNMAQTVREYDLNTVVLETCHSACVPVFIAGRKKVVSPLAVIGVHNPYDPTTNMPDPLHSVMYYEVLGDYIASTQSKLLGTYITRLTYITPNDEVRALTRGEYGMFDIHVSN